MLIDPAYPPLGQFADVEVAGHSTRLHYVDSAPGRTDRPAVVLLHGNPGTVHSFAPAVHDLLGDSHRCVSVDRPGHGYSDRLAQHSGSPTAQAIAIKTAMAKLGIARPILVGHSWGGGLALVWALLFPDEVAGLVLAEGTYYDEPRLYDKSYPLLAAPVIGSLVAHSIGPALAARKMPGRLQTGWAPMPVPVEVANRAKALWTRPSVLQSIAGDVLGRASELPALSERWGEIAQPAVIVNCPQDQFVDPTRHAGRLRLALPHAPVIDVAGVGHALPDARPQVVADAVRQVSEMIAG
jgi:pimeloyl-ACP methyl ester carboxylesterase